MKRYKRYIINNRDSNKQNKIVGKVEYKDVFGKLNYINIMSDFNEMYTEKKWIGNNLDDIIDNKSMSELKKEVDIIKVVNKDIDNTKDSKLDTNINKSTIEKCEYSEDKYKNIDEEKSNEKNKASILNSRILPECHSESLINDMPKNKIMVKVPVVLALFKVGISCEATIKLNEDIFEIKRIDKTVYLKECNLIPKINKLFLSGYVRESIEYAVLDHNSKSLCGDIKHIVARIPFQCVTEVEFIVPPVISEDDTYREFQFYNIKRNDTDIDNKEIEKVQYTREKIYCELISAKIRNFEQAENKEEIDYQYNEHVFRNLSQKMNLQVTVRLLQNQEVTLSTPK